MDSSWQLVGIEITTRVFVGGLPFKMSEMELEECFSQYGEVKDAKIITDRQGVPKGYGFVTFQTEEEAARVQAKGSIFYKEKKLNVSKAIRKQGGQYSRANQEFVNGQRQVFMHSDGYMLSQHGPSWYCEPVVSHSQPTKPCYSVFSPVYTPYVQTPPMMASHVTPPYSNYPSQVLQPTSTFSCLDMSSTYSYVADPSTIGPVNCSAVPPQAIENGVTSPKGIIKLEESMSNLSLATHHHHHHPPPPPPPPSSQHHIQHFTRPPLIFRPQPVYTHHHKPPLLPVPVHYDAAIIPAPPPPPPLPSCPPPPPSHPSPSSPAN